MLMFTAYHSIQSLVTWPAHQIRAPFTSFLSDQMCI